MCTLAMRHRVSWSPGSRRRDALSELSEAVVHLDEMGDDAMRVVCLLSFALALELDARPDEATEAYRRVLELPDFKGSHGKAREALDQRRSSRG